MHEPQTVTQELTRYHPIEGWWTDIEHAVLTCLADRGAMTPAEIGSSLEISESEATTFLAMLAREGKIRIRQVELGGDYKITMNRRGTKG